MTDTAEARLRLLLVRHGQTAWSLSGQHTGRTDIPLTPRGQDEARALAPAFSTVTLSHVLTSPRTRAQQTAALAIPGSHAVVEPDLAEWDYGDYEGQRSAEILLQRPGWNLFHDGCPNGESVAAIQHRTDRLISRLAQLHGTIALFSHGQFLPCLAARWINQPIATAQHLALSTASISTLSTNPHHPTIRTIAQWNTHPVLSLTEP